MSAPATMQPSDWINLGNAICTFLAAAVALGLGIVAIRRERSSQLKAAKLYAARITVRLRETEEKLRAYVIPLGFVNLEESHDQGLIRGLADIRTFLSKPLFQPDDATLLALTPLDDKAAHRIARAFDYIDRVRGEMTALGGMISETTNERERVQLFAKWSADLTSAHDHLQVAVRVCAAAADLAAPVPTGEERYGD